MLGFLKKFKKKKKEDASDAPSFADETVAEKESEDTAGLPEVPEPAKKKKRKKRFSKKIFFTLLMLLIAVGGSAYVVYTFYFAPKEGNQRVYKKMVLPHVTLPEEMLRFSFDYFPGVYASFIEFNRETTLIEKEIARIDAIGEQYPDQKKIADKEKKIWEKTKAGLEKAFLKIEKPVRETYVLFQVNREAALLEIEEKNTELTELAKSALTPALELTRKLKSREKIPDGMIKGTLYKLKKKFL